MIYADHAATTKLSETAFQAMLPWLKEEYGNPSQPYSFSRKPKKAVSEAREIIASCIRANPEEIFFSSGGTESDNWAVKGVALARCEKGKLLTSAFEHHAVLRACQSIQHCGWLVDYVYPNSNGIITPDALNNKLTDDTILVSVMLANNELGTIQPIQSLSEIVRPKGALFHTDAVQAVGHIPIDVNELGVDMLSASAHKFNGPKGVGFLYIRKGTQLAPFENGGGQEFGMRAGTENVAGIVGMAAALQENVSMIEENQRQLEDLEKHLLDRLHGIEVIHHCAAQEHLPGLLSLSFPGYEGEAILHRMDLLGVCISTGSACDSKRTVISHVLQAINLSEEDARGTIRVSLGIDNTEKDVDFIADALVRIINPKRRK